MHSLHQGRRRALRRTRQGNSRPCSREARQSRAPLEGAPLPRTKTRCGERRVSNAETNGHDDIHKCNVLRDLSPELWHQLVESLERVLLEQGFRVREQGEHAGGG